MSRHDPTRSKELRRRYSGRLAARLRDLKGLIRTVVEENDALRLSGSNDARLAPPDDFHAEEAAKKRAAFMQWFRRAIREKFLQPSTDEAVRNGTHFSAKWVRAAYKKGVRHARSALESAGLDLPTEDLESAMRRPIHRSTLRLMFQRNYAALEGITNAVDKEISRTLTRGLAAGYHPRKMAREMNDRIDSVGITRARTLAQTETIRTHSEATLNSYDRNDVDEVTTRAEFSTAGDDDVCEDCKPLDEKVFSVDEARGRIPVHPRCRCSWLPVLDALQAALSSSLPTGSARASRPAVLS